MSAGTFQTVRVLFLLALWCFVMAALSACDTMPAKAEVRTVEVVVKVPCKVPAVPVPAWPLDSVAVDADVFTLAKAALAEIERRIAYELALRAAAESCQ